MRRGIHMRYILTDDHYPEASDSSAPDPSRHPGGLVLLVLFHVDRCGDSSCGGIPFPAHDGLADRRGRRIPALLRHESRHRGH